MAHLSFEYSKDLSNHIDLKLLCDVMRASMIKTTYFPIGGIRVRGFAADVISIADGRPNYNFIDIILRMGEGRSTDEKKIITNALYCSAEGFLKTEAIPTPVALSLEVLEIKKDFSIKRYNTIHSAIEA